MMREVDCVQGADSHEVEAFRRSMHQLVRRFGSLVADSTPCGKLLSLVHAHSLMVRRQERDFAAGAGHRVVCRQEQRDWRLCKNGRHRTRAAAFERTRRT
jgi:hypothetical protein